MAALRACHGPDYGLVSRVSGILVHLHQAELSGGLLLSLVGLCPGTLQCGKVLIRLRPGESALEDRGLPAEKLVDLAGVGFEQRRQVFLDGLLIHPGFKLAFENDSVLSFLHAASMSRPCWREQ